MGCKAVDIGALVLAASEIKDKLDTTLEQLSRCHSELTCAEEQLARERLLLNSEKETLRQERFVHLQYFQVLHFHHEPEHNLWSLQSLT